MSEHRPTILLVVLVLLSLASLASGARGGPISIFVRNVASIAERPFEWTFSFISSRVSHTARLIFAYNDMSRENQLLHREFANLLKRNAEHNELRAENVRLRTMMDFERESPRFKLLPVEVIKNFEGMLTIDRGSMHGMRESMCVISTEGVIGMITQVHLFTSNVITLQNRDCIIDAMIERNRVRGRVHGTGNVLSRICTLSYIDLKDDVRADDLVVTSPDSVFPSGIPIGRVMATPDKGELSQVAEVIPAADPFRVDEVFVLLNADADWKDLAGRFAKSEPVPTETNTEGIIETRTMQDRLAP